MAELRVAGLEVRAGARTLLHGVDLLLPAGQVVAMVGSSGSGKSITTRAILGLLPFRPGRVAGTVLLVDGINTVDARTEADFARLRGGAVGLLFQDARGSLDPVWTIARQISVVARLAGGDPDPLPVLATAGFADPERVAGLYPHELSGGMAQRAAIAVALARRSRFLLADEPTTGLDPSIQRGVLTELRRLADAGMGILFITHDLRLLPGFADRVLVMADGRIVEVADRVADLRGAGRALVDATRTIAGGVL
jgi:ABC-type dipeptide/oligopeptide/nickel transport system ATPase component